MLWQARLEQRLALLRRRRLEDARQGNINSRQAHLLPEPAACAAGCLLAHSRTCLPKLPRADEMREVVEQCTP